MFKQVIRHLGRSEKGQEYVEFALLLPILLLLVMGIIDFGRVFNAYLTITHGAREGVRLAAVGYSLSEVTARVDATTGGMTTVVTWAPPVGAVGGPVGVNVSTSVPLVTGIITEFFVSNPFPIDSTAQMRYEGPKIP